MEEDRIDELIDAILKIAQGDLNFELTLSKNNDKIDSLAMGINMLVDDLKTNEYLNKENKKIKRLNKELKEARKKAEENDLLKTRFLQNISHEIRTPLNAIIGFSDLLPTYINDENSLIKFSQIISNSSSILLQIINDLLDISKIESGQLTIYEEKCCLKNILTELNTFFTEYKNRINKSHLNLKFVNSNFNTERIFIFDQGKLRQILINLISNALKFTPDGTIEIGCFYDEEKQILNTYVKDSGPGIPYNEQQTIFNRFVQSSAQNPNATGGTGLGLSIVKGLLELMNGKIWLESEIDKGTTFHFTLPIKPV